MERKLPDEDGGRRGRRRRRARDASLPTKQVAVDSKDAAVCKRQLPSGDARADRYQESLVSEEQGKFAENTESDDPKVVLEGNPALDSKAAAVCKKQLPSGDACADLYQESVTSEEQGKFAENTESDDPKEGNPALDSKDTAVCKKQLPSGDTCADRFQDSLASEEQGKFAENSESDDPKVLLEGNPALNSKDAAVCKRQLPSGDTCTDLYQESHTSEEQGKFAENSESDDPKVLLEGNPALDSKDAAVFKKQLPFGDIRADRFQESLASEEHSKFVEDAKSDDPKVLVEGNPALDPKEAAVCKKQLRSDDTCADLYQDSEIVPRCYLIADDSETDNLDSIEDSENDDDAYSFALAPDPFIEELPEEAVVEDVNLDMCSLTMDDSTKDIAKGKEKVEVNSERLKQLKKFSKELAKGKEKVEVNQHLQQLKIFSEEFTEKSSKIGKMFEEHGEATSKVGKLRSMIDDIKALAERAKVQNHPGHDVRFEVDATVALSSAREAYAPKKSHGGIEPVIWKGIVGVPSFGVTGNPVIDDLNSALAECYSMTGCILEQRFMMMAVFPECELDELDLSLKHCIHIFRTLCKEIRTLVLGLGGEPLKEPLVYWRSRYVGLKF